MFRSKFLNSCRWRLQTEWNHVRKVFFLAKKQIKSSCNDRVPLDRLYSKLLTSDERKFPLHCVFIFLLTYPKIIQTWETLREWDGKSWQILRACRLFINPSLEPSTNKPSLLKCLSFRNDQHQAFIELSKLEVIIINNLKVQQIYQLDAFLNDAWTLLLENHNLREYKIQNH